MYTSVTTVGGAAVNRIFSKVVSFIGSSISQKALELVAKVLASGVSAKIIKRSSSAMINFSKARLITSNLPMGYALKRMWLVLGS